MLRKLPSQVAAYLSTNQPILWAARIDVAISLAIGLWTLYLILSWIIGRVLADHRDALTQNMRTGPVILLLVLGVSAVLFWFSGVQRAAYREVAPSRRRHPSVIELFVGTALILLPAIAVIGVAGDLRVIHDFTSPDLIGSFIKYALVPSVVLATSLFLILRLEFRTVLYLLLVNACVILLILWLMLLAGELSPWSFETEQLMNYNVGMAISIAWLAGGVYASRLQVATPTRVLLVALTIQAIPFLLLCIGAGIGADIREIVFKGRPTPWGSGHGNNSYLVAFCAASLLVAEWLGARWVRLNLAPK